MSRLQTMVRDAESRTPTLVVLMGPPAVGKMTVGQALARLTGFRLFHNHQVIDLLTEYFPFDSLPFDRLEQTYRTLFIQEAARSGLALIVTSARRFDAVADVDILRGWIEPYVEHGGRVCFAELLAPLEVRLARNRTENRRRHKRAFATDEDLRQLDVRQSWNSASLFAFDVPLLRIDTEHLTAEATAQRSYDYFGLRQEKQHDGVRPEPY